MIDAQVSILVIEDQVETADMFGEMLKLSGYHVMKANKSQDAMDLLDSTQPDAVILDLMMPDISGLEVLRHMRSLAAHKETPVIVVSAKGLPGDVKFGLEAGATAYLTKPVSFLDLKRIMQEVLHASGKGRK